MKNEQDLMTEKLQLIPLSLIFSKSNVRKDLAKIDELADSMKASGLESPIKVVAVDDKFCIEYGHRRLAAARLLNWDTIPAIVRTLAERSEVDLLTAQLIENIQRESLSPLDTVNAIRALVNQHDGKQKDVARKLGLSDAFVSRCVTTAAILSHHPDIKIPQKVTVNALIELSSAMEPELFLQKMVNGTVKTVKEAREAKKTSAEKNIPATDSIVPLPKAVYGNSAKMTTGAPIPISENPPVPNAPTSKPDTVAESVMPTPQQQIEPPELNLSVEDMKRAAQLPPEHLLNSLLAGTYEFFEETGDAIFIGRYNDKDLKINRLKELRDKLKKFESGLSGVEKRMKAEMASNKNELVAPTQTRPKIKTTGKTSAPC